jgi:hypothetical protein
MSLDQPETLANCVYLQAPSRPAPSAQSPTFHIGQQLVLINPRQFQALLETAPRWCEQQTVEPGYAALLAALGVHGSAAQLRMSATKSAPGISNARAVNADLALLQVEINGARLVQVGNIQLPDAFGWNVTPRRDSAAQLLFQTLRKLFASYDIQLAEVTPLSYCLRIPDSLPLPHAQEPDAVIGMDLKAELPTPMLWQKILNDVQIELAQLAPQLRDGAGDMAFNSLWFWGCEVHTNRRKEALSVNVQSDDPILLSLETTANSDQSSLRLIDLRYASNAAPRFDHGIDWYWCSNGRVLRCKPPWWIRLKRKWFGSHHNAGPNS